MFAGYNTGVVIAQTKDTFAIVYEMIHDARIIPIDNRAAALPENMRQWMGDSRGHWEGDTLVIETTNFQPNGTGSIAVREVNGLNFRLTERFTRSGPDGLTYEFTVNDPTVWTKPWSAMVPWTRSRGTIYEYACHEGNYSIANMLSVARFEERSQ